LICWWVSTPKQKNSNVKSATAEISKKPSVHSASVEAVENRAVLIRAVPQELVRSDSKTA
jgi:hypothetical protein